MLALALIVTAVGYRHRNDEWLNGLLRPAAPAAPIKFDNGSVRDKDAGVAKSAASTSAQYDPPPGVMRKCVRGRELLYTDQPCPKGSSAEGVTGGNVTVLQGGIVPTEKARPATSGQKTLRDALDVSGNDNIKEKMIERAVNQ